MSDVSDVSESPNGPGQILTFTNLFPTATRPYHGRFVQERMRRVAAHSGLRWQVVNPVPKVPWPLRRGINRALANMPPREEVDGTTVHNVHYFHVPGVSMRRQARRIAAACLPVVRELCRGAKTVLDAHYAYPDGVAAMSIASELGLPCVVTARGTDLILIGENKAMRAQMREALTGATALFGVSGDLTERFNRIVGDGRAALARNGVDLDLYAPGGKVAARAKLGLPADRPLVLGVGRLHRVKGFHLAAKALDQLGGDALLVLVGEGDDRKFIAGHLPPERLVFLGGRLREDVAAAYRACDLLVLPSFREGWPNVVTEALASGLPVVASAVGAIPDIIGGSDVARLIEPGDVDALRDGIAEFLSAPPDPVQVRALAKRYSWDETVSMLSKLFVETVS